MSSSNDPGLTLSHLDESGQIRMVDVGSKHAKGDVLNTARVAGILAAKRCAELIPLCHSLPLSFAGIDFELNEENHSITVRSICRTDAKTGVEMEAMTACSVAALTIYDMCKAADKGIIIEQVKLKHKSGGKSGEWHSD